MRAEKMEEGSLMKALWYEGGFCGWNFAKEEAGCSMKTWLSEGHAAYWMEDARTGGQRNEEDSSWKQVT